MKTFPIFKIRIFIVAVKASDKRKLMSNNGHRCRRRLTTYRGADKSLARPGRKQATANKF